MGDHLSHLDPDKVLADLKAFAAGNLTAGMAPVQAKALGAAGNLSLLDTIKAAAASQNILPDRLFDTDMTPTLYFELTMLLHWLPASKSYI